MRRWLSNPPEWFMNIVLGVSVAMIAGGVGLMIWGLIQP